MTPWNTVQNPQPLYLKVVKHWLSMTEFSLFSSVP